MTRLTYRLPGQTRSRQLRILGIALAALCFAGAPALAAPAPGFTDALPDEYSLPRFYIETIGVEGIRLATPEIIVTRSLLEEGRPYTESELREAMYRVHRLPFVLDATFSLGKGSERGRYRLLIQVEEVHSFFFGAEATYDIGGTLGGTTIDDRWNDTLTAGVRFFAGNGVFFAAVGDSEDLQVGYTRYRLLDRPVLLRFALARESCCAVELHELGLDPAVAIWQATGESDRVELTLGLPIHGNHSLRLDASNLETASATRRFPGGGPAFDVDDLEQREIELAWVYDTTDDPVFPTLGAALTLAVGLRRLEGDLSSLALDSSLTPASRMSSRLLGLSFFGARHWSLSPRQAVSLSLEVLLSRSEVENVPVRVGLDEARLMSGEVEALEADLGVRYSVSLWSRRKIRRLGELRWETVAGLLYVETSGFDSPGFSLPLWGLSATTSIALRNSWGVFRIGFTYLDYDEAL